MIFIGIVPAFHFMLRVSEYCYDGDNRHAVQVGDVLFLHQDGTADHPWSERLETESADNYTGAIVDVRRVKADTRGVGRKLFVELEGPAETHLLVRLILWRKRAALNDPHFPLLSRGSR